MLEKLSGLSLAWRVSLAGIAAAALLLGGTAGMVSWLVLEDAHKAGEASMLGLTETISRMMDSTDESARGSAARFYTQFK